MSDQLKLPRIEPFGELRADHINKPAEALERMELSIGSNSYLGLSRTPAGTTITAIAPPPRFFAKITGGGGGGGPGSSTGSGPYNWTEQIPVVPANGQPGSLPSWVDGPMTGGQATMNPAYEVNGNVSVPTSTSGGSGSGSGSGTSSPTIVDLRYSETGLVWLFDYAACS